MLENHYIVLTCLVLLKLDIVSQLKTDDHKYEIDMFAYGLCVGSVEIYTDLLLKLIV